MLAVASSRMKIAGPLHQHAHQRHQLALAHRQARAALADVGVQAVGQRGQPLAVADAACQRLDLGDRVAPGRA